MPLESLKRDLVAQIPSIRAEIDRLQRLLATAEAFEGDATPNDSEERGEGGVKGKPPRAHDTHRQPAIRPGNINGDEFVGLSTSQAVKRYLEIMGRGNPQGPRDMAKALVRGGRDKDETKAYANVTSVLKRMKKTGEVRQVRRGEWGLSSWYGPQKPPPKGKGEADDGEA